MCGNPDSATGFNKSAMRHQERSLRLNWNWQRLCQTPTSSASRAPATKPELRSCGPARRSSRTSSFADCHPPGLRRRGAGARIARAPAAIVPVVRQALEDAGQTYASWMRSPSPGPGWRSTAGRHQLRQGPGFRAREALIAVNHLEGHIHAVLLEERQKGHRDIRFPCWPWWCRRTHPSYLAHRKAKAGRIRILVTRATMPRRSLRQGRQLLGLGSRAVRSSTGSRFMATPAR